MLKIKNNNYEFVVTKGAFERQFKPLGYEIVEDKKQVKETKENIENEIEKDTVNDKENVEIKDDEVKETNTYTRKRK